MDPYDFDNDDYVESTANDLSGSFIERLFNDADDEESDFEGFTREEAYLPETSRVRAFHQRASPGNAEAEKENISAASTCGKKRKANPSQ